VNAIIFVILVSESVFGKARIHIPCPCPQPLITSVNDILFEPVFGLNPLRASAAAWGSFPRRHRTYVLTVSFSGRYLLGMFTRSSKGTSRNNSHWLAARIQQKLTDWLWRVIDFELDGAVEGRTSMTLSSSRLCSSNMRSNCYYLTDELLAIFFIDSGILPVRDAYAMSSLQVQSLPNLKWCHTTANSRYHLFRVSHLHSACCTCWGFWNRELEAESGEIWYQSWCGVRVLRYIPC
jgi:hypothetical protein